MMGNKAQNQKMDTVTTETLAEMMIEDVLTKWPETAVVFQKHSMACVGCAVANFYSIADAANVYGVPDAQFLAELMAVIAPR
jgi:hybrid cluster-associated redox disulfide protein